MVQKNQLLIAAGNLETLKKYNNLKNNSMKKVISFTLLLLVLTGCKQNDKNAAVSATSNNKTSDYEFVGGYPTPETVQKAYDDADLNRAIQAYKFFYPTVSTIALSQGLQEQGMAINKVIGLTQATPNQLAYTPNSDTYYAPTLLDLSAGPYVVDMPAGPFVCVAVDYNMRWVGDMGVPGPDAGKGGKHLLVGPNYKGTIPSGYHVWKSTTNQILIIVRALPIGGDVAASLQRIKAYKVEPLNASAGAKPIAWVDVNDIPVNTSPQSRGWDGTIKYWEELQKFISSDVPFAGYHNNYGELAALGITKDKPFAPDARMKGILEKAAKMADAQMRVQSFADRRADRYRWKDRKWEWAALRFEDGDFNTPNYTDLEAREKWFYQATGASPAMFRRTTAAGSLYWLGLRDKNNEYLNGDKTYKLTIPLPVPAKLFWSLTIYDAVTRSEIVTDQNKAALRSLFELKGKTGSSVDLYFGPKAPEGKDKDWIKTIPGKGWFVYFRIYGPQEAAFNDSWRLNDFEEVK